MITNLREEDKTLFLEFLNNHWKKDHIFVKNESLFDYQHKTNNGYSFLVNKNENEISSILGFISSDSEEKSLWLAIWKSINERNLEGLSLLFQLLKKKTNIHWCFRYFKCCKKYL